MWELHNLNKWQRPMRPIMTIESIPDTGGTDNAEDTSPEERKDSVESDNRSKDFSRALAKRKAELEAKYADYDELKKKAEAFDKQHESNQSDMDKLTERIAAIEAERDKLAAEKQRNELVASIAKEHDLSPEIVALLHGADEESLTAAAQSLKKLMGNQSARRGAPPAAHANGSKPDPDRHGMDLLRDAYTN